MASTLLPQPRTGSLERTGLAIAGGAAMAAVAVWALASISIRIGYSYVDPALVGLVCAGAAAWSERPTFSTLTTALWGAVAGVAGVLLGTIVPTSSIPWIVMGAGVALAVVWPTRIALWTIASIPAGALAAIGGHTVGTYLLPVSSELLVTYRMAGLAEPTAAFMLVVVATLIATTPGHGIGQIYISRYQQKASHHH